MFILLRKWRLATKERDMLKPVTLHIDKKNQID